MSETPKRASWLRAGAILAAAAAMAILAAPADADYRRSCRAWLEIRPAGTSTAIESYQWRVYNTVSLYAQVNEARREARRAIVTCMETHWGARNGDAVPYACQSHDSLEFSGYPFSGLADQLRDDICGASSEVRHDVDLVLFIDGERGCVVDGGNINPATRVDIASGYRINCPIPEGGGWERVDPPPIPEGGDWDCVGEGCADTAGGPPSSPPLPGIRLPGNDIGGVWTPGEGWQVCWQMCEDTPACRAWTWRGPGTTGAGSTAGCLLKSRAGPQIPDTCCHSGIKE